MQETLVFVKSTVFVDKVNCAPLFWIKISFLKTSENGAGHAKPLPDPKSHNFVLSFPISFFLIFLREGPPTSGGPSVPLFSTRNG